MTQTRMTQIKKGRRRRQTKRR